MYDMVKRPIIKQLKNLARMLSDASDSIFYLHYGSCCTFSRQLHYAWSGGCDQSLCSHMVILQVPQSYRSSSWFMRDWMPTFHREWKRNRQQSTQRTEFSVFENPLWCKSAHIGFIIRTSDVCSYSANLCIVSI